MWKKIGVYKYVCPNLSEQDAFVIWGYGTWGKEFLAQWEEEKKGNLLAVVDRAAEAMDDAPAFLKAPDILRKMQGVTRVVIAIEADFPVREIRKQIHAWGMDDDRVSRLERRWVLQRTFVPDDDTIADAAMMDGYRAALALHHVEGKSLVRIGAPHDGGYLMLDDFQCGGIAYSFGISNDVSWDSDMADRGYEIFMYDHTIDGLPEERPAFHFFQKGIAGAVEPPALDTLVHDIQANHHEGKQHMILKMDVEGAEWEALLACPEDILQSFDQIVLEIHGMCYKNGAEKRLQMLQKLDRSFAAVHVHANNCGDEYVIGGLWYTEAWEVSYANRATYDCKPGGELYTKLDTPNCTDLLDVHLFQKQEDMEA